MKTVHNDKLAQLKTDIINGLVPTDENKRKVRYALYGSDYDYVFNQGDKQQLSNIEYMIKNGGSP